MQKLKKSLQNNILKINVQQHQTVLSLESCPNSHLNAIQDTVHLSKTLTACSLKQISFIKLFEVSKLKFPLVLNLFKNQSALKEYVNNLTDSKRQEQMVLIKINNNIFKDNYYQTVKNYNSSSVFFNIKNFTAHTLNLMKILKLIVKDKKSFC